MHAPLVGGAPSAFAGSSRLLADAQSFWPSSAGPSPIPSLRALPRPVRNWSLPHHLLPHPAPSKASALSHLGSHWVVCLVILRARQGWRASRGRTGQGHGLGHRKATGLGVKRTLGPPLPSANRVTMDQPLRLCFLFCKMRGPDWNLQDPVFSSRLWGLNPGTKYSKTEATFFKGERFPDIFT